MTSRVPVGAAGAPAATVLFVPRALFSRIVLTSLAVAAICLPLYDGISYWLGPGIALSVFAAWHGFEAGRSLPWIPGLIVLTACVQWVLAAWANYYLQARVPIGLMAVEAPEYFAFAVPATIALAAGLYLPLLGRGRRAAAVEYRSVAVPPNLARTCEAMVIGGTAIRLFIYPLAPASIRFAVYLLAELAVVGAFGLLLLGARGWHWRVALVLGWHFFYASADFQFFEVLLWSVATASLMLYRFRLRVRQVLPVAIVGLTVLLSLNAFKSLHRDELRRENLTAQERASRSSSLIYELVRSPEVLFSAGNLAGQVNRLNEGWVIARIMAWVPVAEPYAGGETIADGVRAAVVPRALQPDKSRVGGEVTIPRFTGIELINGTSIGMSIPGEMYANFGARGAVIGTLLYALFIGWVFARFVRRSRLMPIWWAWAPFVLFTPISAEQDFSTVMNQLVKAGVVMAAVVTVVPGWRELRARKGGAAHPSSARALEAA